MSALEGRYRVVLRLLPAPYRAAWEEEMVATFLETMRTGDVEDDRYLADHGRPSGSEVASVAALAVRLRLGGPTAPPRSFLCGQAVRIFAMVGLLTNALLALSALAQHAWIAGGLPLPAATRAALAAEPVSTWPAGEALVGVLWVAAYLALVAGRRRAAQALALVALLPSAATATITTLDLALGRPPMTTLVLTLWCVFLVNALLVLALAAFHRQAPPPRRRPWIIAFAVGVVVTPVPAVLPLLQPPDQAWLDWPGLLCLAWTAAALLPGVTRALLSAFAVALLALPVVTLRVVSLLDYARAGGPDATTLALYLLEAVAVGGIALLLVTNVLRRLPPTSAPLPRSPSRS